MDFCCPVPHQCERPLPTNKQHHPSTGPIAPQREQQPRIAGAPGVPLSDTFLIEKLLRQDESEHTALFADSSPALFGAPWQQGEHEMHGHNGQEEQLQQETEQRGAESHQRDTEDVQAAALGAFEKGETEQKGVSNAQDYLKCAREQLPTNIETFKERSVDGEEIDEEGTSSSDRNDEFEIDIDG